jgi:hypothetical protein
MCSTVIIVSCFFNIIGFIWLKYFSNEKFLIYFLFFYSWFSKLCYYFNYSLNNVILPILFLPCYKKTKTQNHVLYPLFSVLLAADQLELAYNLDLESSHRPRSLFYAQVLGWLFLLAIGFCFLFFFIFLVSFQVYID